ncbi:MAG: J domain-containing protein [Chloroflexi bacterium]|nr:J domain-containing protein [Chloroflexota bacterium]MYD48575.1 J domain-containing protein [Chloroflexota bacterium]
MADYYDILGVGRTADEKEIRQAYRRLARQHHPDVNPGDEEAAERFKSINVAYEVLSDAEKKAKYDRYGHQWQHAEQFEQQGGPEFSQFFRGGDGRSGGFSFSGGGGSLSDLLGGLGGFMNMGGMGERMRRPPAEVRAEVTLEEADAGTTRLVTQPDGRRLEVKIPAGIADGGKVHIAAGSESGGEFNLVVSVLPHRRFERDGDDLRTTVDVPLLDAVLGGTVKVKTLRGQIELTLPAATQNGRRFRLAGQGMARLNDPEGRGNLYAVVNVTLPTELTDEQRRLFEQLRDAESGMRD